MLMERASFSIPGFELSSGIIISVKLNMHYKIAFQKIILLLMLFCGAADASSILRGKVVEWDEGMKMEMPLPGANVYWLGTTNAATCNEKGEFSIALPDNLPVKLVVSFVGYQSDTVNITDDSFRKIVLKKSIDLKPVDVVHKEKTTSVSLINPINTEKVGEGELLKAACCNLSESFETSPTVNVAYKDAVTGAKEIQLLGLSGIYSQLLTENIPNMRGIAGVYGLTFIPGPWMEGIQITKGSGSVLNGFESTTGQINVEFKKPFEKKVPRFFLNVFGEENGNAEINTFFKHKLNDKWSTILMAHGNYNNRDMDGNNDGWLDVPHSQQINLYNRWQYNSGKKLESQLGFKYIYDKRHGGQEHPGSDEAVNRTKYFVSDIINERVEAFGKLGIVYPEKPWKSIGNIVQVTYHNLGADVGFKQYHATEKTLYYQSLYQSIIGSTNHQYTAGISYQYDILDDRYNFFSSYWQQSTPGAFFQYTYSYLEKLKLIVGVREDYNDKYGWNFTPRFHGKYNFTDNLITRLSAGKSFRIPYILSDNISMLASAKELVFDEIIRPEEAWNYGVNLTQRWELSKKEGTLSVDLYRTNFINQLIVDQYSDSASVHFYNLKGKSWSNSLQVTFNQDIIENLGIRLAYKTDDVKASYEGVLKQKPLVAKYRALFNTFYSFSNNHWKLDYTLVWEGPKKLANTGTDVVYGKLHEESTDFYVMNFQVTKEFKRFEVYAGAENFLDYRQNHPIINGNNPFSTAFDATQVWGPIEGRRIYAGLRYSIK
jgi:outer membrane receptor for ferrienterochelin and colicins